MLSTSVKKEGKMKPIAYKTSRDFLHSETVSGEENTGRMLPGCACASHSVSHVEYCLKSLTNRGAATKPVSAYSAPTAGEEKKTRRSRTLYTSYSLENSLNFKY